MAVRSVVDTIRVALEGHVTVGNTSKIVNVFHFIKPVASPVVMADFDALMNLSYFQDWLGGYLGMYPTTYILDYIRMSAVYGVDPISKVYPGEAVGQREIGGERAPAFVAGLLGWRASEAPGRRGIGKTYVGGLYEQDISGDNLSSASINDAISFFQVKCAPFKEDSAITAWRMGILSDPDKVLPAGTFTPPERQAVIYEIDLTTSTQLLAIMRKRKFGVGS